HVLQHFIVARLYGHFDVRHPAGQFGDGVQQPVGHPVRVAGEAANARSPAFFRRVMDDMQQVCQIGPVGAVLAVAIHNLTEQRDFFHALPRETADVCDDLANAAAALDTTPERDDAEGTSV